MEKVYCKQCERRINRLESYISLDDIAICEECYMNMTTKEFIRLIGGDIKVAV
ncbi:MAG: hypothetical protein IKU87_02500 [Clostridia bacterium]|nr:hypothetical protein [Clostridia bacterium]